MRYPPLEPVDKTPDGCWLWLGRINSNGYGEITKGLHQGRERMAHRASYVALVGPIPAGYQIDHLCRVRHCVNPEHLEAVTVAENIARSSNKTACALRTNHCIHGHELTEDNVYRYPSEPNKRHCRACNIAKSRRRHAAIRAGVA